MTRQIEIDRLPFHIAYVRRIKITEILLGQTAVKGKISENLHSERSIPDAQNPEDNNQ